MKLYVAMVLDRHVDPDCEIFTDLDAAIGHAKDFVTANARIPETIEPPEDPPPGNWLFYQEYSVEGDHVFVMEKELR